MFQATIAGNLGADPELKQTGGGPVLNFSVAVNVYDPGASDKRATQWVRVAVWGKRAEALDKHLSKGDKVSVAGSLRIREYRDRDGANRFSVELSASEVALQGKASGGGPNGYKYERAKREAKPHSNEPHPLPAEGEYDDIPF